LGVAEPSFVAPEDVAPVGAAGLHAVFLDEVPDDLFEGDAAGGEVQAGEGAVLCVGGGRRIHVEMAAWIWESGFAIKLVREDRTAIMRQIPGLITVGSSHCFEARNRPAIRPKRQLNVQVHPVAEQHRLTTTRGG
jgi:hypothetical protein